MEQYNKQDNVRLDIDTGFDVNNYNIENKTHVELIALTGKLKEQHDDLKEKIIESTKVIEQHKEFIDKSLSVLDKIENIYVEVIKKIT